MKEISKDYHRLNTQEKKFYLRVVEALEQYADEIDMNGIDDNINVMKVFTTCLNDYPQTCYINEYWMKQTNSLIRGKKLKLLNVLSASNAKKLQQELEDVVQEILREIADLNPSSDYEKLLYLYDYFLEYIRYDEEEATVYARKQKSMRRLSHKAYGAIVDRRGVCDGIAAAFSLMCRSLGIDSMIVNGHSAINSQSFTSHAWNLVIIRGQAYHMDITWDICSREQIGIRTYDYFCCNDKAISVDHHWDRSTTPISLLTDYSYFIRQRCFATSHSELTDILQRFAKSRAHEVRVRIAESVSLPSQSGDAVAQLLCHALRVRNYQDSISYYWNERTRSFYANI